MLSYTIGDLAGNEVDLSNPINVQPGEEAEYACYFKISNIAPEAYNPSVDPIKIYLRTENGDEELKSYYDGGSDGKIIAYFNKSTSELLDGFKLTLKFKVAGDFDIVRKTAKTEKVLKAHVPFVAPSAFESIVYQADEVSGTSFWS